MRLASCGKASRKGRALFNHRSTIIRFTSTEEMKKEANGGVANRSTSMQPDSSAADDARLATARELCCDDDGSWDAELVRKDLLSMVACEGLGRHVVASADIPPGTVLIRASPFAWCLDEKFAAECCPHCLGEVKGAALPCASCGLVVFCCSACSLNARKTWHGDECLDVSGRPLEPALSGLSPRCRMALRAMRRWRRAANTGSDPRHSSTERTGNGVGSVERGIRFNDLQEHYEQRSQRNIEMLETEAAISAVLACGTPGDVDVNGDPRNEDVCGKLAADMLPALCKADTNGFAVSALRASGAAVGEVHTLSHDRIAVGLYCLPAMLNHSCRPNALARFDGRRMDVVASRAIAAGEGVTISYGPLAAKMPSNVRRRSLQDAYFFWCDCAACRPSQDLSRKMGQIPGESGTDTPALASKNTQFTCTEDGCSGELVLHLPPPSVPSSVAAAPPTASQRAGVSCHRCGIDVPTREFNALLEEGEDDKERWKQAISLADPAESGPEQQQHQQGGGQQITTSISATPAGPAVLTAAKQAATLALRCTRWRDRRLVSTSMQRAEAHDLMARLLFLEQDFAGAAKHCSLAVRVLEGRFSPEDQELGMELAKLAQICFSAGMADQCISACQRAKLSLRVCLRQGDGLLEELDMMEACCLGGGHRAAM